MQFYYLDGLDKKGPYTREELKGRNLNYETLVFSLGMVSWKPIKDIPELYNYLFAEEPLIETIEDLSVLSGTVLPENTIGDNVEQKPELDKVKIPAFIFLLLSFGLCITVAYLIVSSQMQRDYKEMQNKIADILKDKTAITDYSFESTDGQLYDVYFTDFTTEMGLSESGKKDVVRTKNISLASKPIPNSSYTGNSAAFYNNQLERWNLYKDLVQYYESKQLGGFEILRLEKNSSGNFSITEMWSGDMAYKVPESTHHAGYSDNYFSAPGYDIPTYRPSISECYKKAAKFLTVDRDDKTYEAGSFDKILFFTTLENKFYKVSQEFPKYTRLTDKIHVNHGGKLGEGDVIDHSKLTTATSTTDPAVYNSQSIVWYKSLTNTYFIEERNKVFIEYWLFYSAIGISIMTLAFLGIKYRKRFILQLFF